MLAHVPSFGQNPRGSPDFLAYPVPKACQRGVLGTWALRCLGVVRSASSPKVALAIGCSLTPRLRVTFGRVTCIARAASVSGLWTLGFLLSCGARAWFLGSSAPGFACLGFGFGTCSGSGVRLPSSSPSRGLRCVRVYVGFACFAPVLVGVWCAFVWARAALLVVGMRAGALLPSRLSRLGVAVCGQVRVGTQVPLSWLSSRVVRLGRGLVRTPRFFLWWCGRWSWLGFP